MEKAKVDNFDFLSLQKESAEKRHSLIALIHALQEEVGGKEGEFVHYGVTTQDIVDTGIMLQTKEAYNIILDHTKRPYFYSSKINQRTSFDTYDRSDTWYTCYSNHFWLQIVNLVG